MRLCGQDTKLPRAGKARGWLSSLRERGMSRGASPQGGGQPLPETLHPAWYLAVFSEWMNEGEMPL